MKKTWFKLKTCLLPVLGMMLAMAGCGSNVPEPDEFAAVMEQYAQLSESWEQEGSIAQSQSSVEELEESDIDATVQSESVPETSPTVGTEPLTEEEPPIDRDGSYTTAEDVSLYIYTYGELPDNFITKKEAKALGWPGGSLEEYAPGMCIGGDYFGNYEGLLPEEEKREYHECDIDTLGAKSRGAKRLVYSNDGLIYYTEDHYDSFELLYGEE